MSLINNKMIKAIHIEIFSNILDILKVSKNSQVYSSNNNISLIFLSKICNNDYTVIIIKKKYTVCKNKIVNFILSAT